MSCPMPSCRRLAAGLVALLVSASPLAAQSFDFHAPAATRGALEAEILNGANLGSSKGDREFLRNAHEAKLSYGISNAWQVELGALLENPENGDTRLARITSANIIVLSPVRKEGIGLGLFAGADIATYEATHSQLIFGPIAQLNAGAAELLVNPFFERAVGPNSEPGLALNYVWRGKYELSHSFAFGAVGHGRIENIGAPQAFSAQDHRLGPALFFEVEMEAHRKVEISLGVMAGLTQAAPAASVMLNLGIPLGRK